MVTAPQAPAAVALRPMEEADLAAVLALEARVQPRPWTRRVFADELARADRCYLVAADADGAVRGFGGIMVTVDEAHVTTIGVDPDLRRRRVGARLLAALLRDAIARGARAATLEVRQGNDAAVRLYGRFGFAPVGLRPGYYADTGEDALIMWLHDLDGTEAAARLAAREAELALPGDAAEAG